MQKFVDSMFEFVSGKKNKYLKQDKMENYRQEHYLPSYMTERKHKIKNYLVRDIDQEQQINIKRHKPNLFKPPKIQSSIHTIDEYKVYPMTRNIVYDGQPHPDAVIFYFDTEGNTFNANGVLLPYKVNPEEFLSKNKKSLSSSSSGMLSYKTINSALNSSSSKAPSFKTPLSSKSPSLKSPSLKTPSSKSPSFKSPSLKSPSLKSPSLKSPSSKSPSSKSPSSKSSSSKSSSSKSSSSKSSSSKSSSSKYPSSSSSSSSSSLSLSLSRSPVKEIPYISSSKSSSIEYDEDLINKCSQWELIKVKFPKNPYNPYSNKNIMVNGATYKNLDKRCKGIPINKKIKLSSGKQKNEENQDICDKWLKKKNINPVTNRKITKNGSIYKQYDKKCNSKQEKSVTFEDVCKKWQIIKQRPDNKLINPLTKKAIKINGPKYKELDKLCKKTTKSGK